MAPLATNRWCAKSLPADRGSSEQSWLDPRFGAFVLDLVSCLPHVAEKPIWCSTFSGQLVVTRRKVPVRGRFQRFFFEGLLFRPRNVDIFTIWPTDANWVRAGGDQSEMFGLRTL